MEMTVKQNINTKSIVLKHKIAAGATALLEGREFLLDSDVELYVMVSLVNNFIEENLLELVEQDERDFPAILEDTIEPFFMNLLEEHNYENTYYEIVGIVINYLNEQELRRNTMIGLFNHILDIFEDQEWSDLEFFFTELKNKGSKLLGDIANNLPQVKEEPKKVVTRAKLDEFEGASESMKELIQKFQRESQELKNQNNE